MKKVKFLLLTVVVAAFMAACNDESGEFVRQIFTDSQKKSAITKCLNVSLDSALNRLCTVNGFYTYDDNAYRIDYTNICPSVLDTLQYHGYAGLTDSLVLFTNRMAESCKVQLDSAFTKAINSLVIYDYDGLIYGDKDAITNYLEYNKYREIKSYLQTPVSIRMNVFGVNDKWNEVMARYQQYSSKPVNIDLQGYIIDEMMDGILSEMRVQEKKIRKDSLYRSKVDSVMGVIFSQNN